MSLADELERLAELHRLGHLSDDEFAKAKDTLLRGDSSARPMGGNPAAGDVLSEIRLQNELARIDREWELEREQYMIHGRYGTRQPTSGAVVGGIVVAGFGIFWTVMTMKLTSQAPGPVGVIFPLFGVVFTIAAIAMTISSASKNQAYNAAYEAYQARRAALLRSRDKSR